MITGVVTSNRDIIVAVTVGNRVGQQLIVDAVIDTGFDAWLTLPNNVVQMLALPFVKNSRAQLADGSMIVTDIHEGVIEWNGRRRIIPVEIVEGPALIGIGLLLGHELNVKFIPGGTVTITPLPTP